MNARLGEGSKVVVSYLGPDFPGLVHEMAKFLTAKRGNILQSVARVLAGVATVTMLAEFDDADREELEKGGGESGGRWIDLDNRLNVRLLKQNSTAWEHWKRFAGYGFLTFHMDPEPNSDELYATKDGACWEVCLEAPDARSLLAQITSAVSGKGWSVEAHDGVTFGKGQIPRGYTSGFEQDTFLAAFDLWVQRVRSDDPEQLERERRAVCDVFDGLGAGRRRHAIVQRYRVGNEGYLRRPENVG